VQTLARNGKIGWIAFYRGQRPRLDETARRRPMTLAVPSLQRPVSGMFATQPLPSPSLSGSSSPFFGDDWDDVLEAMPTVRKPSAPPANDTRRSGVWRRRADEHSGVAPLPTPRTPDADLAIPLVVRWVDPQDILAELHADPWTATAPTSSAPTLEVLPWEIEIIEDTLELRASLLPPSLVGPLPVLSVTTPKGGLSVAWWLVPAAALGFALAACGWAAGAWLAVAP
jgi:hypothetical protein